MQLTPSGKDALCERRGIVSPDFHCRHYEYDPLKRIPKAPPQLQEFSAEDFSLEESADNDPKPDTATQAQ